jgi:hypothetical protein
LKSSLREVLAESYVAPIAIAILMGRSIVGLIDGLALPVGYGIFSAIVFVMDAVGEREMPLIPHGLDIASLVLFTKNISSLEGAATCVLAAWLFARLVYGKGPIQCLRAAWSELPWRLNAPSIEKGAGR